MNLDDIANQHELLAQHRRTLAIYLRQLANLGADYAPPGVHNGIAESRAEIQRIKAWLRVNGEHVDDVPGDKPTPEETAQAVQPPREVRQTVEGGDHNIQAVDSTVTVNRSSDTIDARGSHGFVNNPTGPIYQNFGTQYITQILQPTPPRFRSAVLRMVEDYTAVFGGRDVQLAALDTFLEGDKPYALLITPTGRGKTALLIHWLAHVQSLGRWAVIFAPISIRYQSASADVTLGAIAVALADLHGERQQLQEYRQTPEHLRALVADYLRRPLPDDRRLLLVLDGLDEAVGWQIGRDLFPRMPGPHLRVVASARQLANTTRTDWLEQLGWRAAQTADLDLPILNRAAVTDILRRMGNPLDTLATDVDLLAEIARVSQGDPLTIRLLVEALQDGTLSAGGLTHLPPGLESFVRSWLDELEQYSAQHDAVRALLGLCATALGPFTVTDLEALAPEYFGVRAALNQAAKSVARFIIGDGSEQSGYVFSHPRLRELFLEKVLSRAERAELQQRFVAYGEQWYTQHLQILTVRPAHTADSQPLTLEPPSLPAYLRQFWIAHLALAGQWPLIRAVLTDIVAVAERYSQPWAAARYAAEGSYVGYLVDLDRLWVFAEERGDLASGLRCALIAASIRRLSGNLSPGLLVGLVTVGTPEGKWSATVALEHVRQMPDPWEQARALQALLQSGCDLPYPYAFEVARVIPAAAARATAIGALAPHLPPDLLAEALDSTRAIMENHWRAEALGALAPHLPPDLLAKALEIARAIDSDDDRAEALRVVVLRLAHTTNNVDPNMSFWNTTLRILSSRGRPALLHDLAALMPWLAAIASPEELTEIATAIRDVARCWP